MFCFYCETASKIDCKFINRKTQIILKVSNPIWLLRSLIGCTTLSANHSPLTLFAITLEYCSNISLITFSFVSHSIAQRNLLKLISLRLSLSSPSTAFTRLSTVPHELSIISCTGAQTSLFTIENQISWTLNVALFINVYGISNWSVLIVLRALNINCFTPRFIVFVMYLTKTSARGVQPCKNYICIVQQIFVCFQRSFKTK